MSLGQQDSMSSSTGMVGPPNTKAPPSQPIPSMGPQQQGAARPGVAPGGPPGGMKPNRVTTFPKPVGIDPVQILHERENRLASR